jgi:hypothetical protein
MSWIKPSWISALVSWIQNLKYVFIYDDQRSIIGYFPTGITKSTVNDNTFSTQAYASENMDLSVVLVNNWSAVDPLYISSWQLYGDLINTTGLKTPPSDVMKYTTGRPFYPYPLPIAYSYAFRVSSQNGKELDPSINSDYLYFSGPLQYQDPDVVTQDDIEKDDTYGMVADWEKLIFLKQGGIKPFGARLIDDSHINGDIPVYIPRNGAFVLCLKFTTSFYDPDNTMQYTQTYNSIIAAFSLIFLWVAKNVKQRVQTPIVYINNAAKEDEMDNQNYCRFPQKMYDATISTVGDVPTLTSTNTT